MSRCNPALRWGAGTTCEKVVDTAATREIEQRLAAMRRDRDSVDKMWSSKEPIQSMNSNTVKQVEVENDKKYITFRSSN